MSRSLLSLLVAVAASWSTAGPATADGPTDSDGLIREWTTGLPPVTWGFGLHPLYPATEVRLRVLSPAVEILDARRGPGLPDDWTVTREGGRTVVARGATPIPADEATRAALVVETNRSNADIGSRGVKPVRWELRTAQSADLIAEATPVEASFPPVLELSDAVSRGLVLATIEPHSSWGPAEITVDNPTWEPLWLDLPPGSVVRIGGEDWIVGLIRPFRMMRKQKTGRTIDAFPLEPPTTEQGLPRRLKYSSRPSDEHAALVASAGIAVRALREKTQRGERRAGRFEALLPFDFWPLVFKWQVWRRVATPPRELLVRLVTERLEKLRAAGDPLAQDLSVADAVSEVEATLGEVETASTEAPGGLPLHLEASRRRFQ